MNTEVFDLGKIGITLGGEYDNKVIYEKLTIVLYKGKSYISTKTTQGVSPEEDILVWQLVAEAKDAYHMLIDAGKTTLTEEEFLEQLVDATKGRYILQGNITNAADEEDLTVEHSDLLGIDTLKLANRDNANGTGYVILRKNKSFAEQVTKENTIYEIRYNFDLNGQGITIPERCTLKFDGGSLSNGEIIGSDTNIKTQTKNIFQNIKCSGTFSNSKVFIDWFTYDYNQPCDDILKSIIILGHNGEIILNKREYHIATEIVMNDVNIKIKGNGASIIKDTKQARFKFTNDGKFNFYITDLIFNGNKLKNSICVLIYFSNINIQNCKFIDIGDINDNEDYIADGIYIRNVENATVSNCYIRNCKRDGLNFCSAKNLIVKHCFIENCKRYGVVNDGSQGEIEIYNINYHDNIIKNCDGGLHGENKLTATFDNGQFIAYNNLIIDCGITGESYISAIVSGNNLHANIYNNKIKNYNSNNKPNVYAINFSNPLSIKVSDNIINNVPAGIGYSQSEIVPTIIDINNNFIYSNNVAISTYGSTSETTIVSNNNIFVNSGIGIQFRLSSKIIVKNNIIKALTADLTENKYAINAISTPSATIINNRIIGNFKSNFALWKNKTNGTIGVDYVRKYTILKNDFKLNNIFDTSFEVENTLITLYYDTFRNDIASDIFSFVPGDKAINSYCIYYYNTQWEPRTLVMYGEYSNINWSLPKGSIYFAKDFSGRGGSNGLMMISTGNQSFYDIYGGFHSRTTTPKYIGSTEERPINQKQGFLYYDKTLNKYIVWNGTIWVNMDGTALE